jgi:hypothetical protein
VAVKKQRDRQVPAKPNATHENANDGGYDTES